MSFFNIGELYLPTSCEKAYKIALEYFWIMDALHRDNTLEK